MFNFLRPRSITVTTNFTPGEGINRPARTEKYELVDGPLVAIVGLVEGIKSGDFGYLFVEQNINSLTAIYAWPLPLWAVLRLRVVLRDRCYGLLRRLYNRHLIHYVTPEYSPIRLRDLRLGAGRRKD